MHSALESPRERLKNRSASLLGLSQRSRLLLSAPLFAAFFLLGNFISALGAWLDLLKVLLTSTQACVYAISMPPLRACNGSLH
jgi:hypothetical protein